MRARDFIVEYKREPTIKNNSKAIIARLATDSSRLASMIMSDEAPNGLENVTPEEEAKLANGVLHHLESADKTKNKQYVQWLLKQWLELPGMFLEDILSTVADDLYKFHQLKTKNLLDAANRDIGTLNAGQMANLVTRVSYKLQDLEDQKAMDKGDAKEFFSNDKVRIIVPEDETAACYYGQGTRWCTAATNHNMFNRYNKDGPMFILLPKQPHHEGEKYQLHFDSKQFMDENDDNIDVEFLLQDRFGDLRTVFSNYTEGWILFAHNDVIEKLLSEIYEHTTDDLTDQLTHWEINDDSYTDYLEEYEGGRLTDDDDNIDWDKVGEAGINYLDFNGDAKRWFSVLEKFFNMTGEEFKWQMQEVLTAGGFNEDRVKLMSEIEDVVSDLVSDIGNGEYTRIGEGIAMGLRTAVGTGEAGEQHFKIERFQGSGQTSVESPQG